MTTLWNHPHVFWALLALPAIAMLAGGFGPETYAAILHASGEFSARLMVVALTLTPLRLMFPRMKWLFWLMRRRRYLGVAAFFYAVLHLAAYLADKGSLPAVLAEISAVSIWTGWAALVILVALAATSNTASVQRLGDFWKPLQRLAYVAALLSFLHWITNADGPGAIVTFLPLALLELYRVTISLMRPKKSTRRGLT